MEIVLAKEEANSIEATSDETPELRALGELVEHLRHMVNNPAFSDVMFVCHDGNRVQALRKLLAGRSVVLRSMLFNGMAESHRYEIEFPEISSFVLLSVFEFLYTGTLLDHLPHNLKMACEVVVASRFFLLPKLEEIARKFVHAQIAEAKDLQRAASLLTETIGFKALCDEVDVNRSELVTILSSNWSEPVYIQSLSEDALQYLLANSRSNFEDDGKYFSFSEYLRFRQVIRWWAFQRDLGSVATEELVAFIAPDERRAKCLCRNPEIVDRLDSHTQDTPRVSGDDNSFQLDEASHLSGGWGPFELDQSESHLSGGWGPFQLNQSERNSVIRLASNIDCRKIHPLLLVKVVEPLGIVSAAEIQNSLRFHALQRSIVFKKPECVWAHGESYWTRDQGYVIHKIGEKTGFGVMSTAIMSSASGDYEWRFVLEKVCSDFVELGFMYFPVNVGVEMTNFDGKKLSSLYRARVLKLVSSNASVNWITPDGQFQWKVLEITVTTPTTAVFNYSRADDTGRLRINDKDFGVVWKDLPKRIYYPAVCLGDNSSRGCVRIELERGFEIL